MGGTQRFGAALVCGICGTSAMHMCGISAVVRTLTASLYQSSTRGVTSGVQTVSTPCVTYPCSTRGVTRGVQTVSTPSVPPPQTQGAALPKLLAKKTSQAAQASTLGPGLPHPLRHPDGGGTRCAVLAVWMAVAPSALYAVQPTVWSWRATSAGASTRMVTRTSATWG